MFTRRIACYAVIAVVAAVLLCALSCGREDQGEIERADVERAGKLTGLEFTVSEIDSMLEDLTANLHSYRKFREARISNAVPPALLFNPVPAGAEFEGKESGLKFSPAEDVEVPEDLEKLSFCSVRQLAGLIRERRITSTELTRMYISRLKRYGPELKCVITLTEELALKQAGRADREIAEGNYRGVLHGIPYGVKDLFSVKGYKTTWGAMPYRDQVIDENAAVIDKLNKAGAVLVAKLTLGALAWGDVWYGGKTLNPWNLEEGSSGSSAGPASAAAAGLVAFSIGTETWGSIVSPSTRCGVTGLRPTFGRVSRSGAMALSWSMDKIGPICRYVEDCAVVFDAIRGPAGNDAAAVDLPFNYNYDIDLEDMRIGYLKGLFESDYRQKETDAAALRKMRELGAELIPVELPDFPVESMSFILNAEAAAAFDRLTRSGEDDMMVRQGRNAWPNVFRASRLIPAVEYIRANRVRYKLIQEMEDMDVDLYLAPSFGGNNLLLTNLTGHPCVVVPNGFDSGGDPVSISFIGKLFEEGKLMAVAKKYQDAAGFKDKHPPLFR